MSRKQALKGKATGKTARSERTPALRDLDAGSEQVKGGTTITPTLVHEEKHAVDRSPVADLLNKLRTIGLK